MKYAIHWRSKITDATGHGTTGFAKQTAQQIVNNLNKNFPQLVHWIMPIQNYVCDHG